MNLAASSKQGPTGLLTPIRLGILAASLMPGFVFRRSRSKPSHDDAFVDLFGALASVFAAAADMKPEWRRAWEERDSEPLPVRFGFGSAVAADGGHDLRFAVRLLQRNRWKSRIDPLFTDSDVALLADFEAAVGAISGRLLALADAHSDQLRDDEVDWINAAVEQFDEATRQRRKAVALNQLTPSDIAAAVYQPVYIAIQLGDRLAERLFREWEAQQ